MSDLINRKDIRYEKMLRPCGDGNYEYCDIAYKDEIEALPSAQPEKAQLSGDDATKDATFDCISRQAAIDEIHRTIFDFFDIVEDDNESPITYKDEKLLELNKAITQRIRQLPSVERKGKWIYHDEVKNIYGGIYIECSECGEKYVVQYVKDEKFCRNCGARMLRGEEDEVD